MSKRHYRICIWITWLPNSAFLLSEATRKIKEKDNQKEYWKTKGSHDRDLNRFVSLHGFATESVMFFQGFETLQISFEGALWNNPSFATLSRVRESQLAILHPIGEVKQFIFATRQLATRMVHEWYMWVRCSAHVFTEVYFKTLESLDLFSTYATSLSQFNLKVPVVFYINSIQNHTFVCWGPWKWFQSVTAPWEIQAGNKLQSIDEWSLYM